jgi:thiol-disulfide isomerase/thioredoxin
VTSSHDVEDDQQERDPVTLQPLADQAAEHEVDLTLLNFNLSASLGLSSWFAWEMRIPIRVVSVSATFLDSSGGELPNFTSIHHRDETVAGIGDVELGGRFRLLSPSLSEPSIIDVFGAVSMPTGSIEDNPFELGSEGREHQHIFFGSGTIDPLLGLNASRTFGPVDLAVWVSGRTPLYHGNRGFRQGARVSTGIAVGSALGLDDWHFNLGPELYHEEPSSWEDSRTAVNSGRTDLAVLAGVFWKASEAVQPYMVLKKPFTLRTEGGQFNLPLIATLGVEFNTGLFGESAQEDDHGHGGDDDHDDHDDDDDHDDHDDHDDGGHHEGSGDVVDVATGGETFDLKDAIVPGKITVVDFWATWCHPCEHIDNLLRDLAAEHPDLAVRRAEVVDSDDAIVSAHLGDGAALPVVRIYDAQGKLVREMIGTTDVDVKKALLKILTGP